VDHDGFPQGGREFCAIDRRDQPVGLVAGVGTGFCDLPRPEFREQHAHRLLAAVKGNAGSATLAGDNNFTYVDGSGMGPVYPGGLLSAFATVADRERRKQIQDQCPHQHQSGLLAGLGAQ
jgi:hypothetical protein